MLGSQVFAGTSSGSEFSYVEKKKTMKFSDTLLVLKWLVYFREKMMGKYYIVKMRYLPKIILDLCQIIND